MPSSTWPVLDHPGVLAFAHRGGAGDHPENTLPAFQAAAELGYRYVETDAHATADGKLVAFHDDHLDRVTDRSGEIAALRWAEVSRARVDGREPLVLLEDLLGSFPELRVNIDPKHDEAVEPLADVLRRTGALDRVCVGSFSDRRQARLRELLGPRLCTSLGPKGVAKLRGASWHLPAGSLPGGCAQVPHKVKGVTLVDRRFVSTAHRLGLQVHVWTVDEPAEIDELCELGVDGLMTDRPEVLKATLQRRGQWA